MSAADLRKAVRECRACEDLRYRRVARAVTNGASIAAAARAANIERQHVYQHRAKCHDFRRRLDHARRVASLRDRMRDRPLIISPAEYITLANESIERSVDDFYKLEANAPRPRIRRNETRRRSQQRIVEYIAEHPGASLRDAAIAAGEKPATVRSWYRRDPAFRDAVERAQQGAP